MLQKINSLTNTFKSYQDSTLKCSTIAEEENLETAASNLAVDVKFKPAKKFTARKINKLSKLSREKIDEITFKVLTHIAKENFQINRDLTSSKGEK